jgi:hypothetical protein
MVTVSETCYAFVLTIMGIYLTIRGLQAIFFNKRFFLPTDYLALWIIRSTRGEEAAKLREAELSSPKCVRLSGYFALATGLPIILIWIIAGVIVLWWHFK